MQKILSFPLYESRDQRDCAKSYFSQFKFLRLIQKNKRAWNLIKFPFINLIQIILVFTL